MSASFILAFDARAACLSYFFAVRTVPRWDLYQAVSELADYLRVQARQEQLTRDYDFHQRLMLGHLSRYD